MTFLEFQQAIDHPETAEPWVYDFFSMNILTALARLERFLKTASYFSENALNVVSKDYLNQQLDHYQRTQNDLLVEEISLALKYYNRGKYRIPLIRQQNGAALIASLYAKNQCCSLDLKSSN